MPKRSPGLLERITGSGPKPKRRPSRDPAAKQERIRAQVGYEFLRDGMGLLKADKKAYSEMALSSALTALRGMAASFDTRPLGERILEEQLRRNPQLAEAYANMQLRQEMKAQGFAPDGGENDKDDPLKEMFNLFLAQMVEKMAEPSRPTSVLDVLGNLVSGLGEMAPLVAARWGLHLPASAPETNGRSEPRQLFPSRHLPEIASGNPEATEPEAESEAIDSPEVPDDPVAAAQLTILILEAYLKNLSEASHHVLLTTIAETVTYPPLEAVQVMQDLLGANPKLQALAGELRGRESAWLDQYMAVLTAWVDEMFGGEEGEEPEEKEES